MHSIYNKVWFGNMTAILYDNCIFLLDLRLNLLQIFLSLNNLLRQLLSLMFRCQNGTSIAFVLSLQFESLYVLIYVLDYQWLLLNLCVNGGISKREVKNWSDRLIYNICGCLVGVLSAKNLRFCVEIGKLKIVWDIFRYYCFFEIYRHVLGFLDLFL